MVLNRVFLALLFAVFAVSVVVLLVFSPLLAGGGRGGGRYFLVDVVGERFVIYVTDEETIRLAEDNLRGLNNLFPTGELERGDGGFNRPWSWHLRPDTVRLVEVSIEVCDGLPSHVEHDLDYWVDTVGRYCPWSGRIIASADSPAGLYSQPSNI